MAVVNATYEYPQYFTVFLDTSITRTYRVNWDSMGFGAPLPSDPNIQPIYFSSQFGSFDIGGTHTYIGSHLGIPIYENQIPTQITSLTSSEFPGSYSISGVTIPRVSSTSGFTVTVSFPALLSGNDSITGGGGNDKLYGFGGDDYISGAGGDDYINGGTGADTMVGGLGDDTYIVDHIGDTLQENLGEGVDTVIVGPLFFGFSIANRPGLENVTLSGNFSADVTGNAADNVLIGNVAVNILTGVGGNDTLDGRAGADTMAGGTGDDTYFVDNVLDIVSESANQGTDTVNSSLTFSLVLRPDLENVTLLGTATINATGNSSDNVLMGNAGANILDGGLGADAMAGGAGNDTYIVDDESDAVMEVSATGGIDTVRSSVSFILGTLTENLVLTGTADVDGTGKPGVNRLEGNVGDNVLTGWGGNDVLIGNAGDDTLNGGTGADKMTGGSGDDVYFVDTLADVVTELSNAGSDEVRSTINYFLGTNIENLTLTGSGNVNATGNALANVLIGNGGNNVLNGGLGADSMLGGAGNDTYVIDNPGDSVTEIEGEGTDTVRTIFTTDISARPELENITLLGAATINATGNAADNVLMGNGLANILTGNDGNDTLIGGAGADTLIGGLGDDTYVLDSVLDVVDEIGGDGSDTVQSTFSFDISGRLELENITLLGLGKFNATGNSKNNVLTGNVAANILNGGTGADAMAGGLGNDTYIVDDSGDTASESSAAGGLDAVKSSVTFTLGANIENLLLTGTDAIDGTGNASVNRLEGNAGENILNGLAGYDVLIGAAGNDTLDGGEGNDSMAGGLGDDVYHVDAAGDVTTETLNAGLDLIYSSVSRTLGANFENLTLTGFGNINATGNALANVLIGNSGNNILTGGLGADAMAGGIGDDTYVIESAGDTVTENPLEGFDTVVIGRNVDLTAEFAQIENVTLSGTGALNATGDETDNVLIGNTAANTLTGNDGNDTLDGRAGADMMIGGAGNDTYRVDNSLDVITENVDEGNDTVLSVIGYSLATRPNLENVTLLGVLAINATGNAAENVLIGNAATNILNGDIGNDILDGGLGADRMLGGAGDDTYFVDNPTDVVFEMPDQGLDLVFCFVNYTLAADVENLTQLGNANINANGNALGNTLTGNSGNNVLNGGLGDDILVGGAGNDTYVLDNANDTVVENPGEGEDTVQVSFDYTLGANVENLTLTGTDAISGTGNELDNVITGNAAANTLEGGAGDDVFIFGAGDTMVEESGGGTDTVVSSITHTLADNFENLTLSGSSAINGTGNTIDNVLTGNAARNVLIGGEGNDTLNGGAGIDTLLGGLGNDTYFMTAGDVIFENPDEGTDLVQSAISYALTANVEDLTLIGAGAISGTGNALDNVITGNAAANVLSGGEGNDILNGGPGVDRLLGGYGDDIYYVSESSDTIVELFWDGMVGYGNDAVFSSASYVLPMNVENLTLIGSAAINGTGNGLDNIIIGNAAANVLSGGGGNDILAGGLGDDIYLVDYIYTLQENFGEGIDTVMVAPNFNGYSIEDMPNLENVTLSGGFEGNVIGNASDNVLIGNAGLNTLTGGDGNDKLDGRAGADSLYGNDGDDHFTFDPSDLVVDGGSGSDTLQMNGSFQSLDLSIAMSSYAGLELIDLTGTGNNTLTITAQQLRDLSDIDRLLVQGDAGDSIISMGQGWVSEADQNIDGNLYHTYTTGTASLFVDTDLTLLIN